MRVHAKLETNFKKKKFMVNPRDLPQICGKSPRFATNLWQIAGTVDRGVFLFFKIFLKNVYLFIHTCTHPTYERALALL